MFCEMKNRASVYSLQLARQWNKCFKHCLHWDSSLPLSYPTL